ncbi:MAG: hypothetical protein IPL61_40860 [Myxococcales bacterium]|nr:hypothetical protein [Myxococcales bacterium]
MYADSSQMIAKKKQTASIVCIVAAALLVVSLFLPWLKSNKSMGLSMTLLSFKQCGDDHCEQISNLKLVRELNRAYARAAEVAEEFGRDGPPDLPKKPGTSFAYFGLITLAVCLLAAGAMAAAGILGLTGRFIRAPIAITTVGLLTACLGLITGCIFVAVKPGDDGPWRTLGVSWPFFVFGTAVVAGVAGCQMLAKAFGPPEYDPYADPTMPQPPM